LTQNLILGLDIGTSSVRAALYDERGEMLPETLVKNERSMTVTDEGGAELDAEKGLRQVVAAIDEVLRSTPARKGQIVYVAQSSFWHSLVGVDPKGKPTTKVLAWGDTRSRKFTSVLKKRFDERSVHSRTGARFHSSFWPAKLLWLRKEAAKDFARTDLWLSFSDFVALRLLGVAATSVSMASASGIFDNHACAWDTKLSHFLGIRAGALPLVSAGSYTFYLNDKFAKRWPRLREAQWFPAIGDGAANNIGAGCVKRSRAALMIGTSGAMRVAYRGAPPKKLPSGLWCYRIDDKRVILGGALSDGGGLYGWLKDHLSLADDDDRIEAEIAKRDPAAHGLAFMPFLQGERSTGYNENAGGAIIGLRSATDNVDIVQAALESVAYRFAEIFDQLNTICNLRDLVASGGALRQSPVWTQIIADVIGRNLTLPDTHEASMRGAVLLALETAGKIKKIEDAPTPTGKKFTADKSRKAIYATARKRHQEAYKTLIDRDK
jgi:gluconokinase